MKRLGKVLLTLLVLVVIALGALLAFPPERWIADRIEALVHDKSGYTLSIGELELSLLQWRPVAITRSVSMEGAQIAGLARLDHLEAAIDLPALLKRQLLIDRIVIRDTDLLLERAEDGSASWVGEERPPSESTGTIAVPAIRRLSFENVQLRYSDAVLKREATLAVQGELTTLLGEPASLLTLEGAVDGQAANLSLALAPASGTNDATEDRSGVDVMSMAAGIDVDLSAVVADAELLVTGTLGESGGTNAGVETGAGESPDGATDIDLSFDLSAETLDGVESLARVALPPLEPISFSGNLLRTEGEFIVQRFALSSTGSDVEGDVRFDPDTAPATLYANVIATTLDLDALLEVLGRVDVEEEVIIADSAAADESANGDTPISEGEPPKRLISRVPLAFDPLFQPVQGAIELRIDKMLTNRVPLDALDVALTYNPEQLVSDIRSVSYADGTVSGNVTIDRTEAGGVDAAIELELSNLEVETLLQPLNIPEKGRGRIGGRARLWTRGKSAADLAASLDGGLFLLSEGGQIGDFLVEMAGLDLFQAIGDIVAPGDGQVDLRCAYIDLQSEKGLIELANFVLDTDDTVFLGAGSINLVDETLDLRLEPHAKDPSLIAASTPMGITGSMQDPGIDIGASLPARGVAMAALASLANPAMALLPLIDLGGGEDSRYCSNLSGALAE